MQRVTIVRYTTKPDRADENEALSRAVFAELRVNRPREVAYALFRDGADFLHLFVNLSADDSEAVTGLSSFKAFSKDSADRYVAPPEVVRLSPQLVESYGLAGTLTPA
jgi:hypothetical protein